MANKNDVQLAKANQTTSKHGQHRIASWSEDIADDILIEIQLIILALAAGINDAITFPDYRVFVSNQTGNSALLAVGVFDLGTEIPSLSNIGFALGLFVVGGLLFGQIGDRVGPRKKGWLVVSNVVQTAIMFGGAACRHWLPENGDQHDGPHAWAVISLLAFASGGQVAMARTINMPEIPTAMVTSAYVDMIVDPKIFARENRPRNRRFFFVLVLIVGSFIGAATYKRVEAALSILLASICKALVCPSLLFNRAVQRKESTADEIAEPREKEGDPA